MTRHVVFGLLLVGLLGRVASAGEKSRVEKDVSYDAAGGERTKLDVYGLEGKDHPIVVWIHGGAWVIGNKSRVESKPRALNERGYVMVSINYRLHPKASYKEQAGDVAKAIHWVKDHAREFGGDPSRIYLMGHSAGAHLAALVGIDGRYLAAEKLSNGDLAGVILLDGAGYDIPKQIEQTRIERLKAIYTNVFSKNEATQKDASPITHVKKGVRTPPFLILHVASRDDSKAQSEALASKLNAAGGSAMVVPARGKTHATINRELGEPDDPPTKEVFAFLGQPKKP